VDKSYKPLLEYFNIPIFTKHSSTVCGIVMTLVFCFLSAMYLQDIVDTQALSVLAAYDLILG